MNDIRTLSDTKRAFYACHTRPIDPLYRRAIEELLVEMHLLATNVEFQSDAIYVLGVTAAFDGFMVGYQPDRDIASLFNALCRCVEGTPEQYRQEADRLLDAARQLTYSQAIAALSGQAPPEAAPPGYSAVQEAATAVAGREKFKYSRPFGIGLYALVAATQGEAPPDEEQKTNFEQVSAALHLPADKLQKDLELYRSSLEKLAQMRETMADMLAAERRKREQREQAKAAAAAPPPATEPEAPAPQSEAS